MSDDPLNIGVVVPGTNTTMAPEVQAMSPPGTTVHRAGLVRGKGPIRADELDAIKAQGATLANELAAAGAHMVAYGCTAAGFLDGPRGDARFAGTLSEVAGVPAVTTAGAMVAALRQAGVRRPAVVTPYMEDANARLVAFLEACDFEVSDLQSFHAESVEEYTRIEPEAIRAMASRAAAAGGDGVFIACTELRTVPVLEKIEDDLGLPAISANQATVWACLKRLGRDCQGTAIGSLLEGLAPANPLGRSE
jgi:maleate cis-trans isomerase